MLVNTNALYETKICDFESRNIINWAVNQIVNSGWKFLKDFNDYQIYDFSEL